MPFSLLEPATRPGARSVQPDPSHSVSHGRSFLSDGRPRGCNPCEPLIYAVRRGGPALVSLAAILAVQRADAAGGFTNGQAASVVLGQQDFVTNAAAKTAAPTPGTDTLVKAQPLNASAASIYRIGVGDVLYIKVWNSPNLTSPVEVGPDGILSMPLIGEVKADGLTREQLKEVIATKLSDFRQSAATLQSQGKLSDGTTTVAQLLQDADAASACVQSLLSQ